jgi:type II secretory pathway component HofQ
MRVALLCLLVSTAHAGDICTPGAVHRGTVIDLDVKQAEVQDVLRLLVDAAKLGLVVGDTVTGKVTLHLKRVAWDAAACTVAALHHLRMSLDNGILLVTPLAGSRAPRPTGP